MTARSFFTTRPSLYGVTIFVILAVSSALSALMASKMSVDGGKWPLALTLYILIDAVYAGALLLAAGWTRYQNLGFAVVVNAILALVLLLRSYLFYAVDIDWGAVNSGVKRLTLFQTVIRSDVTPWALYLTAFLIILFVSLGNRHGVSRDA